jgi:hypothetical protein
MNKSGHIDDCAPYIAAMWAQSRWQLSQPRHRGVNVQVIHSVPKACWFVGSDRNYTAMRTHVQWSVHLSALLIT